MIRERISNWFSNHWWLFTNTPSGDLQHELWKEFDIMRDWIMTDNMIYRKGKFELEEWEDVNYCEHDFSVDGECLTNKEVIDLLNEQDQQIFCLQRELDKYKLLYSRKQMDYMNLYRTHKGLQDEIKELAEIRCDLIREIYQKDERIQELENKLNKIALEFLNYEMITMGKATEISEMNYHEFLKYRKENGNPMELQL